ncbi:hypothetical protein ELQ35_01065 [Peribacillus cavernae]|uniref:Uncharacterized protein n=1 Tax=Peribacillus cavernae TaxID=1674310 RepID=A0A433HWI2_9BACI|nr:hypothetical protein [Peribacillus cavernae]MDQ0218137.1 Asp-tRNA(Asn)/Glu-tRNA(Gln) amidotransferase A subunit family amidase [Peribacillus cavernae]RUQ32710.1 hypothetical protein ELQ35_01065 [Peribacillus cavernae]
MKTIQSEAYAIHEEHLQGEKEKYQPEVLQRLEDSLLAKGYEYVQAQHIRKRAIASFNEAFELVDVIVVSTPILELLWWRELRDSENLYKIF